MVVASAILVRAAMQISPLVVFGLPSHDFVVHGGNSLGRSGFFFFCFYFSLNGCDHSAVPWIVYFRLFYRVRVSLLVSVVVLLFIISFFYYTIYLLISLYFWLLPTSLLVSTYGSYRASSDVKITVSFLSCS